MAELYKGVSDKKVITISCSDCAHRNVCIQAGQMDVLKRDICETVIESDVSPDFLNLIEIKCSQYLAPLTGEEEMPTLTEMLEDFKKRYPGYAKHLVDYYFTEKPSVIQIQLDVINASTGSNMLEYDYKTKEITLF